MSRAVTSRGVAPPHVHLASALSKRIKLAPCRTCSREGHPGRTCDQAMLDRHAVALTEELEAELARAPTRRVVERRPLVLPDEPDRERRVELLECSHEVTVFSTDSLEPTRRCDRCPPDAPPPEPTPAARELLPEMRAALTPSTEPERARAGREE